MHAVPFPPFKFCQRKLSMSTQLPESLLVNLVWGTVFTSEYCMGYSIHWWLWGYSTPWGGGGGVRYSLVNNICGVRYSLGYRIHSDTGDPFVLLRLQPSAKMYTLHGSRRALFEGMKHTNSLTIFVGTSAWAITPLSFSPPTFINFSLVVTSLM